MNKHSIVELSHLLLRDVIKPHHVIIDATVGHGYDTLYIASLADKVIGFDIQKLAIDSTMEKIIHMHLDNVELILDSHRNYQQYVSSYDGVVFNLGYLPHGDKKIHTQSEETVHTIKSMLDNLNSLGFMLIVVYPGHDEGYQESLMIDSLISSLDRHQFHTLKLTLPYQPNNPPYILHILKT